MIVDEDFSRAASLLDCDEAAVKAFAEVESSGAGFTSDGNVRVLFEAHLFSRYTNHRFDQSNPDLSSPTWNRSLYATGTTADDRSRAEYKRLGRASLLDRGAALMSASYGVFQVCGFNFALCGFADIEDFRHAMQFGGERAHLDAFVEYVIHSGIQPALRAHDWTTCARLYNGPLYGQNQYDKRLAAAWAWHDARTAKA